MPALTRDFEGLRVFGVFSGMFGAPNISDAERKWRSWLMHCLLKTSRHYNEARKLVLDQISERERPVEELMQGRQLPMLDFALEMEDCITSLDKAFVCIDSLVKNGGWSGLENNAIAEAKDLLRKFRNKQEHMHLDIASGQTGNGPILVSLEKDDFIKLRNLSMPLSMVHELIDSLFLMLSSLYPQFTQATNPAAHGTMKITMTGLLSVGNNAATP